MTIHLYELTDAYRKIAEAEDIPEEELTQMLGELRDLIKDKALNIGRVILSMKATSEAVDTEIKRLTLRKQAMENKAKSLKSYLEQEMQATNTDKVKDETLTISLVSNPPSVQVSDETLIPPTYWRIIPETKEVDKKLILSNFKDTGEIVRGTEIITDKKHILIR